MLDHCRVEVGQPLLQQEAAGRLGVSTRTLRRWHQANFGPPATRVGSALLYDRAAVEAFARGVR